MADRDGTAYKKALKMDKVLRELEKEGATNVDMEYSIKAVRTALDGLLDDTMPYDVYLKKN